MSPGPSTSAPERDRFVEDLLAYMTLEEKAGQLALTPHARDDQAFHDQLRRGLVSGVIGPIAPGSVQALQRIAIEESRLGIPLFILGDTTQGLRTRIPPPAVAAASWDPAAIEAAERCVAEEAAAVGINWAYGTRLAAVGPLFANGFETASGESPWLAARLAAARIRGLQATAPGEPRQLLAGLQIGPLELPATPHRDETPQPETLAAVLATLEQSQPGSIQFEALDPDAAPRGPSSAAMARLVGELGLFDGIALAEWAALAERSGQPSSGSLPVALSVERLVAAVGDGRISHLALDAAVRCVLAAKYDLGLFRSSDLPVPSEPASPPSVRDAALDLARKSIVLLRNDAALLPLTVDSGDLLIVGNAARDRQLPLGDAAGSATSVIDGLEELGIPCKFVPGLALRQEGLPVGRMIDADRMAIGMAGEAARRSRTVVLVLGQPLANDALSEAKRTLVETLLAANPRLVVVTLGVRPMDPDIAGAPLGCLVHAGQLGTHSGRAIAEVLTGEHDASGRLPFALRTRAGAVRLPFGHGLSFADTGLTDFTVELGADRVLATASLRNFGEREGSEVVQLFVRQLDGPREAVLRGFRRVHLRAGGSERVTFELGAEAFGTLDERARLTVAAGGYEIRLGFNAERLDARELFLPEAVAGAMVAPPARTVVPIGFARR